MSLLKTSSLKCLSYNLFLLFLGERSIWTVMQMVWFCEAELVHREEVEAGDITASCKSLPKYE